MAATVTVKLAGGYPIEQLDRLVRDLQPLLLMSEESQVQLDLGGLVHLCPAAFALLTATVRDRTSRGLVAQGWISDPPSPQVANYLARMDLLHHLGIDEPETFTRREPVGFRPCQNFQGEEYHLVAKELTDALSESCITDRLGRGSVRVCLDELAENVLHHADAVDGGFAVAQGYVKRGKFEVAIADLGIGVGGSLRKNPVYAGLSDLEATAAALNPGVSSTPERNAGIGLFVTKLLLASNGGILLLRSGKVAVMTGAAERSWEPELELPGTVVTLRARTDRPLNINEVYRSLDADGGNVEA